MKACSIDNCDTPVRANGFCNKHYLRWHRHGDPLYERKQARSVCGFTPCERFAHAKGLCDAHWSQARRGAELTPVRVLGTLDERIEARTRRSAHCWSWDGAHADTGYAQIRFEGKLYYMHRLMYEREKGTIAPGMEIDHTCHNRGCINPAHLEQVTHKQNGENRGGPAATNTSGYRGVTRTRGGRWVAQAGELGTGHYFGTFDTAEEAAKAASVGRRHLFANSRLDVDDLEGD